jgi:hypothetical protein
MNQITQIISSDFESFVSDVAAALWNQLIQKPAFDGLKPRDFPEIYEVVARTLQPYREKKLTPSEANMSPGRKPC